ncbi:MAG TPA: hypothetical protein VK589_21050 [Chryseolinea sp.]|nr:hypothetical protein [Chryseolinea sp.]
MELRKEHLLNEETIYITTYNEKASYFRGRIIDGTISIEMKLAETLSCFFNHDEIKQKFILSSVFTNAGLSFASKSHILMEVLFQFFPQLLQLFPTITEEINSLIRLRTVIDHSMTDTSNDFIRHRHNDRVQLIYFADGQRKQMSMTDAEFNGHIRSISVVLVSLDNIKSSMRLN